MCSKCDWIDLSDPIACGKIFSNVKTFGKFYKSYDEIYRTYCSMNFIQKVIWSIQVDCAGFHELREIIELQYRHEHIF